jgi:hypothetical protein
MVGHARRHGIRAGQVHLYHGRGRGPEKRHPRGAYNPLRELYLTQKNIAKFRPLLEMLIGQCAMAFEKLPIVQDAPIIKNVLYCGIWLKYDAACAGSANEGNNESGSV